MIDMLVSTLTGRRHHFKLVLRFQPDRRHANYYAERITTVWMKQRSDILDERQLRKMNADLVPVIPRHNLNNGGIDIREVYYRVFGITCVCARLRS